MRPSTSAFRFRALAALFSVITAVATPIASADLQDEIDSIIRRAEITGTKLSYLVVGPRGVERAALMVNEPMIPASNMKLLTSGAALLTLGPDFDFQTKVSLAANRLIIEGDGDPLLGDPIILGESRPAKTPEELLEKVAAAVAAKAPAGGLGEIIVDDRVFDQEFAHPSWAVDQLNRAYSAEVGGLNFHLNTLVVFARPARGQAGGTPTLSLQPAMPWIRVNNKARTVRKGNNTLWIARPRPENSFTLYGDIAAPTSAPIRVAIHDPSFYAARLLADRIEAEGIPIERNENHRPEVRRAMPDETVPEGTLVAVVRSSLMDVLIRCNRDSLNLSAEALLKRVGHAVTGEPGSWENGGAVLSMLLAQHIDPTASASTTVSDGSGLSRDNRVTADTLADWLRFFAEHDTLRDEFVASLAVPGTGTLRSRFAANRARIDNRIHAKSGYLNGVRSLSGYVIDPRTQETSVFVLLANDIPNGAISRNVRTLMEDIVLAVDDWMVRQSTAESFGG